MNKTVKRLLLALMALILLTCVVAGVLFFNDLRSLSSLKQQGDAPLFTMTYYGDYGFDDFLKVGAQTDRDIEQFVVNRLLKGVPFDFNVTGAGCSAFYAQNETGGGIYGRNFDFDYAPALVVTTTPENGYASVSTVNLSFAGYGQGNLPTPGSFNSFLTLAAPYLPFDGMNEAGLCVSLLAVPEAQPPYEDGRVMLNTTTAIRLMLDKAATVAEAVELISDYNLYFSGDVQCHYLVSDATGDAAVIEFWQGVLHTVRSPEPYEIATNFVMADGVNLGEGFNEFERFDTIETSLSASGGIIGTDAAMALLSKVAIPDRTRWSVVYDTAALTARIAVEERYDSVYEYALR